MSTDTAAYQRATYLAAAENAMLQAVLRESDGEERGMAVEVGGQLLRALDALGVYENRRGTTIDRLGDRYRARSPAIARYLTLLDDGRVADAQEVIEEEILAHRGVRQA